MSTFRVNAIKHPSSSSDNITLNSDGTITTSGSGNLNNQILEVITGPCDGGSVTSSNGTVTFGNVTAVQNLNTTYTNVNGSVITYQPPTGTDTVIYRFCMQIAEADADMICHIKFYVGGNEVVFARHTHRADNYQNRAIFEWPIKIGGSVVANTGRIASWNSGIELKLQIREYNSSYETKIHTTSHWDGSGTDMFSMPTLTLTAIGQR